MAPSAASAAESVRTTAATSKGPLMRPVTVGEMLCDVEGWLSTPENVGAGTRDTSIVSSDVGCLEVTALATGDLLDTFSLLKEDDNVMYDVPALSQTADTADPTTQLFTSFEQLMDVNNESMAFHDEEYVDDISLHPSSFPCDADVTKRCDDEVDESIAMIKNEDFKISNTSSAGDTTPAVSPMSTPSPLPSFRDHSCEKQTESISNLDSKHPSKDSSKTTAVRSGDATKYSEVDKCKQPMSLLLKSAVSTTSVIDSSGVDFVKSDVSTIKFEASKVGSGAAALRRTSDKTSKNSSKSNVSGMAPRKRKRDIGKVSKPGDEAQATAVSSSNPCGSNIAGSRKRSTENASRTKTSRDNGGSIANSANLSASDEKNVPVRDRCIRCQTPARNTPMMRKGPDGCRSMCNACGLRWARHGIC